MEFQLSGVSLVTLHSHTDTNCSSLHYNFFNVLDDNVLDDDGSAKDKEDHNHDGAHNIADADNNVNNNQAVADPHLTVEDFQHEYK